MWAIAHKRQDEFYLRSWTPGCGDLPVTNKYEWSRNIDTALKFDSTEKALLCIANHDMQRNWMLIDTEVIAMEALKKSGHFMEGAKGN